jgi:hypothetical protein
MTSIELWGAVNTVFIIFSVYGVFSQLSTIHRRRNELSDTQPTALLSLNQFTVSFFAYLSFFVYGYSITPFNHFIVWPRLIASLVVLAILFEIVLDRKTKVSKTSFGLSFIALILGVGGLIVGEEVRDGSKLISTTLLLSVSLLIAQGYAHQINMIIKGGDTGAVDIKMSQFILLMDMSTIAMAFAIGITASWPLLVLAVTSAITKVIILFLFYWVRVSQEAKRRRDLNSHSIEY